MDKFVHYTNYDCMDYIRQEGLKPQIGPRTEIIGDTRKGTFLSIGMINSITMYYAMFNFYNNNKDIIDYDSFYDFLGGYGYCLSVNNLDYKALYIDPVDCYCINTIPSENINVLVLKNKNKIIDSRETVLLYCMKKMIAEGLFKPDPRYNVDKYMLLDYLIKNAEDCNLDEYELEEYSLQFYNYKKHVLKPIIIKPLKFN